MFIFWYGLTCVSLPILMLKSWPLVTHTVALFESRLVADVVLKMRSYPAGGLALSLTWLVLYRKGKFRHKFTQGTTMWWCMQRLEWCSRTNGGQKPPEARREAWDRFLPRRPPSVHQGTNPANRLTPWSGTSYLQNYEIINFYLRLPVVVFCYGGPSTVLESGLTIIIKAVAMEWVKNK